MQARQDYEPLQYTKLCTHSMLLWSCVIVELNLAV
jgi:hypothetical protein